MWPLRRGMIAGRGALDVSSGDAAATTAFLARTSGLDGTHTTAYKDFINGIVADGIFSNFDAIYIIATQDLTTARLNIIQNNFNLTGTGMTFVADRGATGSGANVFSTGFTPSTAGGVFVLNDAHLSIWGNGTGGTTNDMGYANGGAASGVGMAASASMVALNQASVGGNFNTSPAGNGFFWGQRTASNAIAGYKAAPGAGTTSTAGTASTASTALTSGAIGICTVPGSNDSGRQISAASIGKSMSAGDIEKYYDRLQAFMTAVGN